MSAQFDRGPPDTKRVCLMNGEPAIVNIPIMGYMGSVNTSRTGTVCCWTSHQIYSSLATNSPRFRPGPSSDRNRAAISG